MLLGTTGSVECGVVVVEKVGDILVECPPPTNSCSLVDDFLSLPDALQYRKRISSHLSRVPLLDGTPTSPPLVIEVPLVPVLHLLQEIAKVHDLLPLSLEVPRHHPTLFRDPFPSLSNSRLNFDLFLDLQRTLGLTNRRRVE